MNQEVNEEKRQLFMQEAKARELQAKLTALYNIEHVRPVSSC